MSTETTSTQPPIGKWIALFVAIAFGVYVFVTVALGGSSASGDEPYPRGEAWDSCKRVVAANLTNPDSADFGLLSTDFAEQPDGGWSIAGSVKADNDFGVTREFGYSCHVTPDGKTTASVS